MKIKEFDAKLQVGNDGVWLVFPKLGSKEYIVNLNLTFKNTSLGNQALKMMMKTMEKLKVGDKISYTDPRITWKSEEIEEVLKQGQWAEYSLIGTDEFGRTITGTTQSHHIEPDFDEVEIDEIETIDIEK